MTHSVAYYEFAYLAIAFISFVIMAPIYWYGIGLAEYISHVYVLHNSYHVHLTLHHRKHRDYPLIIFTDLPMIWHLLVVSPILLVQSYLIQSSNFFISARTFGAMLSLLFLLWVHSYVWSKMHRAFHKLEYNWTEQLKCYDVLYSHHIAHHESQEAHDKDSNTPVVNWGVLFMCYDRLFGTLKGV